MARRTKPVRSICLRAGGLAAAFAGAAAFSCAEDREVPAEAPLPVDGGVSTDTPEATLAGLHVLSRGGNAVDAAVAVSLVLGVTQPSESGLGGSVVMLLVPAGGAGMLIDGAASPMEPDALAVLHHAWRRYGSGRVSWEELVEPALRAASDGYRLGHYTHRTLVRHYDRVLADEAARGLLLTPDHAIPPESSRMTNPDLARLLARVSEEGPGALYGGEVGAHLAAFQASTVGASPGPATVGAADSIPPVRERAALMGRLGEHRLWVAPEPYGGPRLLAALALLELPPESWIAKDGWTWSAWLAEAFAYAWSGTGHPVEHLATLPPLPGPARAERVDVEPAATPPPGAGARQKSGSTTHFSVIDDSGNAVAVTQTLGASFGAGLVPGLGIFHRQPGDPSAPAPLVPTVVTREGRATLALGSPGGDAAVPAVAQVLVRVLLRGEGLPAAIGAPRLVVTRPDGETRGRVFLEGVSWHDSLPLLEGPHPVWGDSVQARTRARGFQMGEQAPGPLPEGRDPWFGSVNAVAWDGASFSAVGDERRGGVGGVLSGGAPSLERTDAPISPPAAPGG